MATILIADDDEGMRLLLSMSLEMSGHRVLVASNGAQGLDMAQHCSLDLLVVDANMPPWDGVQVIAQLRAEGVETPAILITAGTQQSVESRLDARTRFLAKPFSPPRFISYVSDVLADQAGEF